ncbi:heat-inducible transcriptional repressor HrcA [Anaerobacillus isosaccharinicus]|uniref:Heat-inducible transcription repressor HrcA n=1 Tax=Anaerobacillus isosaccharinicus TaxID=1532552 RepID=A0A1S2LR74_9BACI|nr:heat-inducible transcriptional repressor HrcA [Anaerobacillus isosaccharinicus]MBA5585484.1 heat-inducible transcriptional repressor HrcA [Anaerobacillus isosaccharinicus]QOY36199.1 heat-inducible transcriptional repressor HrcA [Anaerobacillus isosaccharinicus]
MLTERQLLILKAIIDDYIRSAEPVGSRSVSKRDDISYSPATIRNEMADLEELGFLEKPHSSAGRIPSQKGYRYYVDHLLSPEEILQKSDIVDIKSLFVQKIHEVEQVIEQSAQILSNLTSYTSIVLGPEVFETTLKHLQIIPLTQDSAVAIIVTNTGHVEKQAITIPEGLKLADIEMMVNILNERLKGVSMLELRGKIFSEVGTLLKMHITNYKDMMQMLEQSFKQEKNDQVFFGGKTNIFSQPEFRDVEKVRQLLEMFEEKQLIHQIFRSENSGITVKIGQENNLEAIDHCSVITSTYTVDGKHLGTIGILGPTRMEYSRTIAVLDYLSKGMTNTLTNLYQRNK